MGIPLRARSDAKLWLYGYDENGNLLSQSCVSLCSGDMGRTVTYDAGDRMVTQQSRVWGSGGERAEDRTYWYDGLGRRILVKSDDTLAVRSLF